MLFILIPLIIIAIAGGAIIAIVWRKVPALKQVSPSASEAPQPLIRGMFPEVVEAAKGIDFRAYRELVFRELEKLLRWFRLALNKTVRGADSLIHRVRQEHVHTKPLDEIVEETHAEPVTEHVPTSVVPEPENPVAALRAREEQLIAEIAQNPRNPQLYEAIGDVYAKLKSYGDAREAFEAVLKLDPDDSDAKKKLSSVLKKLPEEEKSPM